MTRWLEDRWYQGKSVGPGLLALAWIFGVVARLRRSLYRSGWLVVERLDCPVLVVGNLTVGGAGKTPLTLGLVEGLLARGWRPGVISRGFGGDAQGATLLPDAPDPARFGDEPCLIAERSGVPVAVARRRAEAGRLLRTKCEVNVLIADDALQHLALARDIEVLVIDGRRLFGNARLLPAGPLREPPAHALRCDFRVVNGEVVAANVAVDGVAAAIVDAWPMALQIERAVRLDGKGERGLDSFRGEAINALAGIADPARFFAALAGKGLSANLHPFADHHPFQAADFGFDDGRPLLMTEKDAVKCRVFSRPNWYYVPADCLLDPAFLDSVHARLTAIVNPQP
ncbi:MAG: tetraacyldisaccharide 4'-kinase [Pseudomarimonas sp.]